MHLHRHFKEIYAIEPEQNNYNLLLQNLKDNKLINKTKVLKFAISNISGEVKLFKDKKNSGAHSLLNINEKQEYEIIQSITPKQLFKKYKINNLGFAFFDIEGMEYSVIPDFLKEAKNNVPIFFEFTPHLYGKEDTFMFLNFLDKTYNHFVFYQDSKVKFTKRYINNIYDVLNLNFVQCDLLAY